MHYKNGREAKSGDKVISIANGTVTTGILHSLQPGTKTCNGRVAPTSQSDAYVTIGECMHVDDVLEAVNRTQKESQPD
jgi:hypothetical protein